MVAGQQLKNEWDYDSVFRFFPVQRDDLCGYRLHGADAANNKFLDLAGRSEIRDFLDVLHVSFTRRSGMGGQRQRPRLHAGVPAGPDGTARRLPADGPRSSQVEGTARSQETEAAVDSAATTVSTLPPEEVGCLYLGPDLRPRTPDPASPGFPRLTRHYGRVRGAWPTLSRYQG